MGPLSGRFVATWRGRVPDVQALEAALRDCLDGARQSYPTLAPDEGQSVEYLALRVPPDVDPVEGLAKLRAHELVLACACMQGDPKSIAVFDERHLQPAAAALVRAGQDASAIDDALQVLRERLFIVGVTLQEFSGRGSLSGWVRVTLSRQHASLQRSSGRTEPFEEDGHGLLTIDPELAAIRRRYGERFRTAFHDAFGVLTPEQRNVLRLHFVDGLNLERIAPMLGMSRATVGRRILDAKRALLESILGLLRERLQATPSEVESLLAVVRSTMYGSLGELLRA